MSELKVFINEYFYWKIHCVTDKVKQSRKMMNFSLKYLFKN